jgi:hypothetical protein
LPTQGIIDACIARVSEWSEGVNITSFSQLEEIVCKKLHLTFEMIRKDGDIERLAHKYISNGELAFVYVKTCFDEHTFGALLERRNVRKNARDRHVAFIDCRGDKAARSYFSKWHEIAHVLTHFGQMEIPFHRSTTQKDDIESLMDRIAGEVGFFDPLFRPALDAEIMGHPRLTFKIIEKVQKRICPEASFQSTLIACTRRVPMPMVYVEAGLALKKSERVSLASLQGDFLSTCFPRPEPRLRATVVMPNPTATEAGLDIHRNMEIPRSSVISLLNEGDGAARKDEGKFENLAMWTHSDGSTLVPTEVFVEVRRYKESLYALVSLA